MSSLMSVNLMMEFFIHGLREHSFESYHPVSESYSSHAVMSSVSVSVSAMSAVLTETLTKSVSVSMGMNMMPMNVRNGISRCSTVYPSICLSDRPNANTDAVKSLPEYLRRHACN